jgi:hypothetical protein
MADPKKKPMQVYLRPDQIDTLKAVAERRGQSMAALVREGVDKLLDELPLDDEPLFEIIGLYDSGQGDLAEKHDDYLVKLIEAESNRES